MNGKDVDYIALVTEFIGTFGLVFIGGMVVMNFENNDLSLMGVAFAHMLVLSFMVYFGGRFSGAHFNPAVTASFVITKEMNSAKGLMYIGSQLAASIVAALFLRMLASEEMITNAENNGNTLGFPHVADGYNVTNAVILEAILTFFLVLVIWSMAADSRAPSQIYGLAIGGTLSFAILVAGPLTGAALNPARTFGPAIISGDFDNFFVYWIGPLLGGVIAGILYFEFFLREDAKSISEALLMGDQEDNEFIKAVPEKKPAKKKVAKKAKKAKKAAKSDE